MSSTWRMTAMACMALGKGFVCYRLDYFRLLRGGWRDRFEYNIKKNPHARNL